LISADIRLLIFVFIVEGEQQIRAHKFQIAEENKDWNVSNRLQKNCSYLGFECSENRLCMQAGILRAM
jgi:hypothetical protein